MPPRPVVIDKARAVPALAAMQATLADLRAEGAQRLDPVRFRYFENVCARAGAAPHAVQHIVLGRLQVAIAAYRARLAPTAVVPDHAPPPSGPVRPFASVYARRRAAAQGVLSAPAAPTVWPESVASPLVALNQYIGQVGRQGAVNPLSASGDAATPVATATPTPGQRVELKSARRFGDSWSKLQSTQRVAQALQRAPEHAGPFNPHKLMARTLAVMRDVSPAYLHRFVQQVDALMWLEQALAAHQPGPSGKPKSAKAALSRK